MSNPIRHRDRLADTLIALATDMHNNGHTYRQHALDWETGPKAAVTDGSIGSTLVDDDGHTYTNSPVEGAAFQPQRTVTAKQLNVIRANLERAAALMAAANAGLRTADVDAADMVPCRNPACAEFTPQRPSERKTLKARTGHTAPYCEPCGRYERANETPPNAETIRKRNEKRAQRKAIGAKTNG